MPNFDYTAKSRDGKNTSGTLEAADRRSALSAIERLGLIPLKVTQQSAAGGHKKTVQASSKGHGPKLARPYYMNPREVLLFTSELADLVEGRMTLGNALNCLASRGDAQSGSNQIITALRDAIIEGATFSTALSKFPKVFSPIYINMIRAGEASGGDAMIGVFHRLIAHFERAQAMRSKVIGAMVYPAIVLVLGFAVAVFAITYILPQFDSIFEQMGPDGLPPMTKMLLATSDWLQKYFLFVVIAGVFGFVALYQWIKTPKGLRKWDAFKLKMPLVKGIVACSTYANFARTLQSLLENGVPILQALKITSQTVGNAVIADELMTARDRITDGTTISGPLAAGGVFPKTIIDLIAIGEQRGEIPSALEHIAKRYESALERNVHILTTALEPIMIVGVAVIIGFVAISVMQAVLSVTSGMNIK